MDRLELNSLIGLTFEEAKKRIPEGYLLCPFCVQGYAYLKTVNQMLKIINVELENNIIKRIYVL